VSNVANLDPSVRAEHAAPITRVETIEALSATAGTETALALHKTLHEPMVKAARRRLVAVGYARRGPLSECLDGAEAA
jgi:hypothetical protein